MLNGWNLKEKLKLVWSLDEIFIYVGEDISPFCGATDIFALKFWWSVPFVLKTRVYTPMHAMDSHTGVCGAPNKDQVWQNNMRLERISHFDLA